MQPSEIVSVMAALLYSYRPKEHNESREHAQAAAVAEAWRLWHLTLDHGSDAGPHPFQESHPLI
jgi:hypothetical protein